VTEKHLDDCLRRLDDTRRLLDQIQTDLRGAQEFRDTVFDLLEGTPFGAQADSTYDGLYGRLRAALGDRGTAAEPKQKRLLECDQCGTKSSDWPTLQLANGVVCPRHYLDDDSCDGTMRAAEREPQEGAK